MYLTAMPAKTCLFRTGKKTYQFLLYWKVSLIVTEVLCVNLIVTEVLCVKTCHFNHIQRNPTGRSASASNYCSEKEFLASSNSIPVLKCYYNVCYLNKASCRATFNKTITLTFWCTVDEKLWGGMPVPNALNCNSDKVRTDETCMCINTLLQATRCLRRHCSSNR